MEVVHNEKLVPFLIILVFLFSGCFDSGKIEPTETPKEEKKVLTLEEVLDILNGKSDIFLKRDAEFTATINRNISEKITGAWHRTEYENYRTTISIKTDNGKLAAKVETKHPATGISDTYYVDGYAYSEQTKNKRKFDYEKFLEDSGFYEDEPFVTAEDIKEFSYNDYYYIPVFTDEYVQSKLEVEGDYDLDISHTLRLAIYEEKLKEIVQTLNVEGDITDSMGFTINYKYRMDYSLEFRDLVDFKLPNLDEFHEEIHAPITED
jgi:hypothetical protein